MTLLLVCFLLYFGWQIGRLVETRIVLQRQIETDRVVLAQAQQFQGTLAGLTRDLIALAQDDAAAQKIVEDFEIRQVTNRNEWN